ncbi:MAG: hypothetical protein BWY60_00280 [Actinobacteria bacterium ADurb.Bin346]|nr:MAG: hypothetical protein BWY60_00280 [Actinobacteria bacterium ADurb.Bin346]
MMQRPLNSNIWIKIYFKDLKNVLTFLCLLAIAGFGFYLRIRNLGYLSFWGDDGHTFIGTISILKYGYPRLPSGNILWHGIFDYYLKALPVLIFGPGEFSFRIVSVLSGVGSIIVSYFIGKELANKYAGFLSALIMCLSTWYVQFSREARYYSDYQFFYVLAFLFFYLGFIKDKKPFRVLAAVFMVLTPLVHGVGITLILLFPLLIFYKGKQFFKKEIIIPFIIVLALNVLQIINQVFFWKVGRSFYAADSSFKSMTAAYLKFPDPFYFRMLNIMFQKMFWVFMTGILIFIAFAIFISIRKKSQPEDFLLNENFITARNNFRWPFNLFLVLSTFILTIVFISFGNMYGQQRYMYFLMPLFITGFSYSVFFISVSAVKLVSGAIVAFKERFSSKKREILLNTEMSAENKSVTGSVSDRQAKAGQVFSKPAIIFLTIIFCVTSIFLVDGINFRESWKLAYKKHNETLNIYYSISNSWNIHWDAATGAKYVAQHLKPGDIVITTDIYNSPPYTGKVDYWLWTGNLVSWAPYHDEDGKVIDDTYGAEVLRSLMAFVDVLNNNPDKNVWVLTSKSLFTKEHVDPSIKKLLDSLSKYQVLTARDDVSRLYYFPAVTERQQRVSFMQVFVPEENNVIETGIGGMVEVDFASVTSAPYLIYGFSNVESGIGTWATGKFSVIFIEINGIIKDYVLDITAKPLDNKKDRQTITVFLNNVEVGSHEFNADADFSRLSFDLPESIIKDGINDLVFRYRYSTVPRELKISSDTRELSVLFRNISIKPKK